MFCVCSFSVCFYLCHLLFGLPEFGNQFTLWGSTGHAVASSVLVFFIYYIFLLCFLQTSPVVLHCKELVSCVVVTYVADGISCVVGADSNGYIPLTFNRGQTIDIVPPSASATTAPLSTADLTGFWRCSEVTSDHFQPLSSHFVGSCLKIVTLATVSKY